MKSKKQEKGITLVALVVTIIVLLILAGLAVNLTIENNGAFTRAEKGKEEYTKSEAKEAMNLKISSIQIQSYTEEGKLPDLQYLADRLCEDEEMEYVIKKEGKDLASLDKIDVIGVNSIFTKIKKYPYEFEIDGELKLASIDGVKIANNEEKPNSQNTMSDKEHFIGEYYFNEKPIYSKTLCMQCPNFSRKEYDCNVNDADIIWIDQSNSFFLLSNNLGVYPIPHVNANDNSYNIGVNISGSKISIDARKSNQSSVYAYITIKYTKTTDKGNDYTIPLTPANN